MTIVEALNRLRKDIQQWTANNLRRKLDKNLGEENKNQILVTDDTGQIKTSSLENSITECSAEESIPSAKAVYEHSVPVLIKDGYDTLIRNNSQFNPITSEDNRFALVQQAPPSLEDFTSGYRLLKNGAFSSIYSSDNLITESDGFYDEDEFFVIVTGDGAQMCNTTFPQPGVYFNVEESIYGLNIIGYNGFFRRVIDPEYHPDLMPKILTSDFYGPELPAAGIPGRIFFVPEDIAIETSGENVP